MKHFQILGLAHHDQDISSLKNVIAADLVMVFSVPVDAKHLEGITELSILEGFS